MASPRKKKQPPYLLMVLIPLLLIGVAALVIDRNARQAAESAKNRIEGLLDETATTTTNADIRRLLGRAPDAPMAQQNNRLVERYSWRGGLKTYYIYVAYLPGKKPVLDSVWLNQPPE